ncbi:hypothetical protein BJV78DRAFT_144544 [Lactifluus subvellereus]|nr:hypothetical protein BJV78DRAFT_144544 [Lactifluus subvellereus]
MHSVQPIGLRGPMDYKFGGLVDWNFISANFGNRNSRMGGLSSLERHRPSPEPDTLSREMISNLLSAVAVRILPEKQLYLSMSGSAYCVGVNNNAQGSYQIRLLSALEINESEIIPLSSICVLIPFRTHLSFPSSGPEMNTSTSPSYLTSTTITTTHSTPSSQKVSATLPSVTCQAYPALDSPPHLP